MDHSTIQRNGPKKMTGFPSQGHQLRQNRSDAETLSKFASLLTATFAKTPSMVTMQTDKVFKVKLGEARFGIHYNWKCITHNTLDIAISGKDTDNSVAVFKQTALTSKGGPLHIHPNQNEWFYVLDGEYLFSAGADRYHMKAGNTIFVPRKVPHAFLFNSLIKLI
jgi:quercetin dioxygenase-like cupin family protein